MKQHWRIGMAAAVLALACTAVSAAPKGDPKAGRIKASTCMGCHGITNYSNIYPTFRVPKLGGQHAAYIVSALNEYKHGKREHPTMSAQASSLSEQDIADIAAFLSQAPKE